MTQTHDLNWYADILPGKSIAGFDMLKSNYKDIKISLENLDKNIFSFEDHGAYLEVFDNRLKRNEHPSILISFFFDKDGLLDESNVYKTNTETEYKGKIYGKYGLGDKISEISDFGEIERSVTGEEFFLIQHDSSCGLSVANGLDASLEDDPNQNIAIIKTYSLK